MTVCCPECDQPLPLSQAVFTHNPTCPHCQTKLIGNWRRWAIIQLGALLIVLTSYLPISNWSEQIFYSGLAILLMFLLLAVVPGLYRVEDVLPEEDA